MSRHIEHPFRAAMAVLTLLAPLALCSCDDEDNFDFVPPPGQGGLIVDNNTSNDIEVFVDGVSRGKAGDSSDRAFAVEPGVHRVVLDEKGGDRLYRDDIDILEGRVTVLDVTAESFDDFNYDVVVFFD